MAQLQIPIQDELMTQIKVKAALTGQTMREYVISVLQRAVARKSKDEVAA